jgi:hypothetical protein
MKNCVLKSSRRRNNAPATTAVPPIANPTASTRRTGATCGSRITTADHGAAATIAAATARPHSVEKVNPVRTWRSVSSARCTMALPIPRSPRGRASPSTTTASAITPKSPGGRRRASRTPMAN